MRGIGFMKRDNFIKIEKENTSAEKYGKNHTRNQILVNLITGIRSLGTIAIIPIFASYGALATGLAAMGFFLTDCIDGFLARKLNVQSFFGSLLDALSDKAFGIVCLILLSTLNPIFLAIIGLELGIFAINYKNAQNNKNVKSSYAGKAKTLLLAATVVGSFFCYAAPSIKEVLNYVNVSTFNTLLETNPNILSSILAIPTIGASIYVAKDYMKKGQEEPQVEEIIEEEPTMTLEEIAQQKEKLLQQKERIEEVLELKSREEIIHDLFDTEYYLEHKDDKIKSLLYKKRS
jgi:phosphatidylglycerophosphate synthase